MQISRDALLLEVNRLLGSVPPEETYHEDSDEKLQWLGQLANVIGLWNDLFDIDHIVESTVSLRMAGRDLRKEAVILLERAKRSLEMELGYSVPRNYFEISTEARDEIRPEIEQIKEAFISANNIDQIDREVGLSEIAIFEASLGCARLSSEIIERFVNGFLRGAFLTLASETIKAAARKLADVVLSSFPIP